MPGDETFRVCGAYRGWPEDQGDELIEGIATLVQPDISAACDLSKLDDTGCHGAPDALTWTTARTSVSLGKAAVLGANPIRRRAQAIAIVLNRSQPGDSPAAGRADAN